MKKVLVVLVVGCMLCVSMSGIASSFSTLSLTTEENNVSGSSIVKTKQVENVDAILNRLLMLDESDFKPSMEEVEYQPQPLLGGNEIFGLWIHIIYKDRYGNIKYDGTEPITLDLQTIKGKLGSPSYRTPIKFNVDDDPGYDIETGFGFFRSGIDEIGTNTNHPGWATAFDFKQIYDGLDDQEGELEVWQEFHVNLGFLKNNNNLDGAQSFQSSQSSSAASSTSSSSSPSSSGSSSSSGGSSSTSGGSSSTSGSSQSGSLGGQFLQRLFSFLQGLLFPLMIFRQKTNRLGQSVQGGSVFAPLQNPINGAPTGSVEEDSLSEPVINTEPIEPMATDEDYFITRVGYRSPRGQKIPLNFEKTFIVAKENIFRPFIFQKEMNPHDIIGIATNDVMYGFQAFKSGASSPSYNIEFTVNYNPAVYTATQFIPREGKIAYYYHDCGVDNKPLDITFSSNVLQGGGGNEEEEGTLSLTLTLDDRSKVDGSGKWMSFDPDILGDWEPLGGKLVYAASNKFDVGITITSPRFEQKVEIKDLPKQITFSWDADVSISNGNMFDLQLDGFVDLSMSSMLDKVIVYYPKTNPEDPELTCIEVKGIPSGEIGANARLYVDPDDFSNPENFIFARGYRDAGSDLEYVKAFLPDSQAEPVIMVTDIPAYVNAEGKLWWNKLQGHASAYRSQAGYEPDPVHLNIDIGQYNIKNVLEIRDGHIKVDFHIAEDGYFGFDCTEKMFADELHITDSESDNELDLTVDEVSAQNFWAAWGLDTSGGQIQIEDLALSGSIDTLKGFHISLTLESKNVEFDADWTMGVSGSFIFDFYQEDNIYMDFNLSQGDVVLYGYIELKNNLHWDIKWKWEQGESESDPAYFKINEDTNQPNIEKLHIYFTYKETWGARATLTNGGVYVCIEWYWDGWRLVLHPVIKVYGTLDFWVILDWLTGGEWKEIV